jgi:sigma-B regulation protein RsbU (phosphoserine phosphatase)
MLPKMFPPYPERNDLDIYGRLTPAKEVGGDLFDFFIRDEKLFFCIGDVSGKGVPASLVMAVTRAQFRTVAGHEDHPSKIVTNINELMTNGNDSNMFVTLFVGVLNLKTGVMQYCNAGHDAPLIIGQKDVSLLEVDTNLPVGLMQGWEFSEQETLLKRGSMIYLYTDGLTEAEDINHGQFGEERIFEVVRQASGQKEVTSTSLIDSMTAAVHAFVGEAEQSDDLTMLGVRLL